MLKAHKGFCNGEETPIKDATRIVTKKRTSRAKRVFDNIPRTGPPLTSHYRPGRARDNQTGVAQSFAGFTLLGDLVSIRAHRNFLSAACCTGSHTEALPAVM